MAGLNLKLAAVVVLAGQAFAGEFAILASGTSLHIDRHEVAGSVVRLHANGGVIEMPASQVVRFELEYAPQVPIRTEPQPTPAVADPKTLVSQAAARWGIPPKLLHAIARTESGYNPRAVSPKGAVGVMQLMPETARVLGADPADPRQNVEAGTRYFVELLRKYQKDDFQVRKALAAYNAGPKAVDRYNGIPPYRETVEYLNRVIKQWRSQTPTVP